ncbi:TetR/AcrR family transcriptional regulator [Acidaminobacter sp. JC074]|uniref:TetR/AcrR family transcriptional regulator n=1 Tax=Acidaminobacter sp. JC074 TaxID=2530199 RepID=UPI001F0CE2D2|nr:TetR/AcrR family transcriptional regulator [Acidaminobacter sp. JC074]MCH4886976.1 TetR/AcrR family transcriptional regulator [Acidaminobacter sp. JC074]
MELNINKDNENFKSLTKTKLMIIKALVDLMHERDFSSITITNLCEHAQVGRKTYYRHFESKFEVLITYLKFLMEDAILDLEKKDPQTLEDLLTHYFYFWQSHKSLILLLRQHQLCYLMISVCENYFENRPGLKNDFIHKMPHSVSIFLFSGATRVVQKWIYDSMPKSASQMAKELHDAMENLI